jgi:hypothetical protein
MVRSILSFLDSVLGVSGPSSFDVRHLQENLLQRGQADAEGLDAVLLFVLLEVVEQLFEAARLARRELVLDLHRDVARFLSRRDVLEDDALYAVRADFRVALDDGEVVACPEAFLEEERAAAGDEFSFAHDADAVAQVVRLVHVVRGQDDDPVLFVALEHLPEVPARVSVHA